MQVKPNPARPIRILLVEDNEDDRIAFRRTMETARVDCLITECSRAVDAEFQLAVSPTGFDLLVVDQRLPDMPGIDFCRKRLATFPRLPMVILTAYGSESLAVEAMKAGIAEYLPKDDEGDYLGLLPAILPEVVKHHCEQCVRLEARQHLEQSQRRLQQIVEGSSVATFVIDQDHVVSHWNRACEVATGTPAAHVIGTREQWRAFYDRERPVLADLILDGADENTIARYYAGKFHKSALIEGAFEAEDFFPAFGEHGRWLYFTAAPLRDDDGRVIGAIETLQDFTERRRAEAALRESEERYRLLSITDNLTNLYNSRSFHDQLGAEVARAARYGHRLALMVLDVDDFKQFNDRYGHLEGDCVLVKLAQVIRHCLRRGDSAYRLGGEEFVVLLPETGIADALHVAERVRNSFSATPLTPVADEVAHTTVSIGVTEYRAGEEATAFFRRGDGNMYLAKQQGKNRVAGDL